MAGVGKGRSRSRFLTEVDDFILKAVYAFHMLTLSQLLRLRWASASEKYVGKRLKRLTDEGYLETRPVPRIQGAGTLPLLYQLGRAGLTYCKNEELPISHRFAPSEFAQLSFGKLSHILATNDVLIAARQLEQMVEGITVREIRHDLDLSRTPVHVETGKNDPKTGKPEREAICPDGWIDFRITQPNNKKRQAAVVLELDRGKMNVSDLKSKLRGLLSYSEGPYQEFFGTTSMRIAFVIEEAAFQSGSEAAERRRVDLLRWMEEVLKDEGKHDYAELFFVTTLPPADALDPVHFFLSQRWSQPFVGSPLSLLVLPENVIRAHARGTRQATDGAAHLSMS